ncbi:MAG: hypothetical protein COW02_10445 [Comamonadaceae bacterium CG12_big_fil_rev_8_21_14_0_65_59_15]|nr:MAG: hypothetical protein COW02_10445 [Comamonadaceae bacterium CG12_big_fil_rev_8_21_14_0_65_59_15]
MHTTERCYKITALLGRDSQFIPLAEESGLIVPIGRWVLEAACAQLKSWSQHEHTGRLALSVNVSARHLPTSARIIA